MNKRAQIARLMSASLLGVGCVALLALPSAARPGGPAPAPGATRSVPPPRAAQRPNIVVILVDDMGFSDIASYGGEIPTPNLDKLAAGGLRFTQFYNTGRCSPSRAALMTGLYPHQAGVGHLEETVVDGAPGMQGRLADRAVTIAEVLHQKGYFTGIAGKWHLGITHGVGPWQRGFDHAVTPLMGGLYFPDQTSKNQKMVFIDGREVPAGSPEVGSGYWYGSDLWVDWEKKFIDEANAQKKPFFLYLPFTAPHFPLMAPQEDIAKFKGKYLAGWDALRRARFERQKKMGLIPQDEALPPALPAIDDWSKLSPEQRERFDTMMAVYAAAISRVDKAIGDLVAKLKSTGQLDNTLILFMSDNGGNAESGPNGKATGEVLGSAHSNIWVGENWATLQNTPFQWFKRFTQEGGISTPLIAYWPRGITAKLDGGYVRAPGHLIDVMPTLVEVAGASYPKNFKGHDIIPMQGRSFAPAFRGAVLTRTAPIFWEHQGNRAIRDGKWKLMSPFNKPWQLYDIEADRAEMHDLATRNPAIVARLSARWDAWAKASYVNPWTGDDPADLGGGDGPAARPRGAASKPAE
jgi:arylsulfatase A-like enzyme